MKKLILFSFYLFVSDVVISQQDYLITNIEAQLEEYRIDVLEERTLAIGFSFGFSMEIGKGNSGSLRAFANIGFLQKLNKGDFSVLVGGQSHLEFYRGGLGTSLKNKDKGKINIELRNGIAGFIGYNSRNYLTGKPAFVNVNSDASALYDPLDLSLSLGTMFINGINHSRNQRIGTGSLSINHFMLNYYNDGPPYDAIMTGDAYDRYWTGGGQAGLYYKKDNTLFTDLVLRFDNYTGYQVNLYEVGSLLQIAYLPYILNEEQMYNSARYQYKLGLKNSIFFNFSIYEPKVSDIQDLIHYHISISPFHTRPLTKRHSYGVDYNYKPKFF